MVPALVLPIWMLTASAAPTAPETPPAVPQLDTAAFKKYVEKVRKDAAKKGLSAETLKVLDDMEPIPKVIELDRRQPHKTMTFARYLEIILTGERISKGRTRLREDLAEVEQASKKYGVPPEIIVALWGVETRYGEVMGDFNIPTALATLGWEGRRGKFFTAQLLDALTILDQKHIEPERMKGSWAGAMGHCQFMPSTFLAYAADGDGDGRRDIWTTKADVFASAANYLSKIGWNRKERWGREVQVPEKFDPTLYGLNDSKSLAEWRALGLKTPSGGELPDEASRAWLIRPNGEGRAVLAYPNFKVLLKWNRSHYFAAGVGLLSDELLAAPAASAAPESTDAR